jgi:hypothetical protein
MEHYVTLFDSLFLPQGLALHMSMERHVKTYVLWILCVDDEVYESLTRLNLPNVRLLQLSSLETPELLAIKPTRTKGEYCWTLTPFAPRFVFETDATVARVTYLDADLWFRKSPKPIFDELDQSGKHVLITDHAYAPEYDQSATSGQYCVQFMTFTRDGCEVVRKWWEEKCIEWCYARFEEGRFGDQKYLDDWPERFSEHVHVLNNKELALAPWNATRFPYGNSVFWHFHGLRIEVIKKNRIKTKILLGYYILPKNVINNVYKLYKEDIVFSLNLLNLNGYKNIKSQINISLLKKLYLVVKLPLSRFNLNSFTIWL